MIFQSTIIANGILMLLHDAEKKGLIKELVETLEKVSQKNLGKHSERVQLEVIESVLLPLALELVSDNTESLKRYQFLLDVQYEFVQGRIEAFEDEAKRAD